MSEKFKPDVEEEEEEEEEDDDWEFCKYCNIKFDNQVKYNAHIRSMTHTQNVMMWNDEKEKKYQMTKSSTGTQKKDISQEKGKADVQKKDNIQEKGKIETQKKDDNQEKNEPDTQKKDSSQGGEKVETQKGDSQGTEELVPSNSTGTKRKIENPYFCKICNIQLAGRLGYNLHVQTPKHMLAEEQQKNSSKEDSEDGPAEKKLKSSSSAEDEKQEGDESKEPEKKPGPSKEFYCSMCRIQLSGSRQFNEHVIGKKHIRLCQERRFHEAMRSQGDEGDTKVEFMSMSETKHSHYYCKVCCVQCTGKAAYQDHVRGKNHLKRIAEDGNPLAMIPTNFVVRAPKGLVPCEGTTAEFQSKMDISEEKIVGEDRVLEIYSSNWMEIKYYCELCEMYCNPMAIYHHFVGHKHRTNLVKLEAPEVFEEIMNIKKRSDKNTRLLKWMNEKYPGPPKKMKVFHDAKGSTNFFTAKKNTMKITKIEEKDAGAEKKKKPAPDKNTKDASDNKTPVRMQQVKEMPKIRPLVEGLGRQGNRMGGRPEFPRPAEQTKGQGHRVSFEYDKQGEVRMGRGGLFGYGRQNKIGMGRGGWSGYGRQNEMGMGRGVWSGYDGQNEMGQGGWSGYDGQNEMGQGGWSGYDEQNEMGQGGWSGYDEQNEMGQGFDGQNEMGQGGWPGYDGNNEMGMGKGGQFNYERHNNKGMHQGGQSNYDRQNNKGMGQGRSNYDRQNKKEIDQGGQSEYTGVGGWTTYHAPKGGRGRGGGSENPDSKMEDSDSRQYEQYRTRGNQFGKNSMNSGSDAMQYEKGSPHTNNGGRKPKPPVQTDELGRPLPSAYTKDNLERLRGAYYGQVPTSYLGAPDPKAVLKKEYERFKKYESFAMEKEKEVHNKAKVTTRNPEGTGGVSSQSSIANPNQPGYTAYGGGMMASSQAAGKSQYGTTSETGVPPKGSTSKSGVPPISSASKSGVPPDSTTSQYGVPPDTTSQYGMSAKGTTSQYGMSAKGTPSRSGVPPGTKSQYGMSAEGTTSQSGVTPDTTSQYGMSAEGTTTQSGVPPDSTLQYGMLPESTTSQSGMVTDSTAYQYSMAYGNNAYQYGYQYGNTAAQYGMTDGTANTALQYGMTSDSTLSQYGMPVGSGTIMSYNTAAGNAAYNLQYGQYGLVPGSTTQTGASALSQSQQSANTGTSQKTQPQASVKKSIQKKADGPVPAEMEKMLKAMADSVEMDDDAARIALKVSATLTEALLRRRKGQPGEEVASPVQKATSKTAGIDKHSRKSRQGSAAARETSPPPPPPPLTPPPPPQPQQSSQVSYQPFQPPLPQDNPAPKPPLPTEPEPVNTSYSYSQMAANYPQYQTWIGVNPTAQQNVSAPGSGQTNMWQQYK